MKRIAIAIALASGCGAPAPVPVKITAQREDPGDHELVTEAMDRLGLEWEPTSNTYGSLSLILSDKPDMASDFHGITVLRKRPCIRFAVAYRSPKVVAHELAHQLRLEHICESSECNSEDHGENLMRGDAAGTDLDDWQFDKLERQARLLNACR